MNGKNLLAPPERPHDCCRYIIRFVSSLNLAVLKPRPREDKHLLLWYCLRAIDTNGRGFLDQGLAIHILSTAFSYQRQTVYKHLDKGAGA